MDWLRRVEGVCRRATGDRAGDRVLREQVLAVVRDKDAAVGILTDGDGLYKVWGSMSRDKYAKVMPYIGQTVEITGTEVVLSNNYDVRSFDVQTIKTKKR